MMWPTFASVEGFRKFHGTITSTPTCRRTGTGIHLYTHDAAGELAPDWRFPRRASASRRSSSAAPCSSTGLFWIVRGLIGTVLIPAPRWMLAAQLSFFGSVAAALTLFGAWTGFLLYWIVPYCTWHIAVEYARLICEHSAVESDEEEYADHPHHHPTFLERLFVLAAERRLPPRASLVSERAVVPAAGAATRPYAARGFERNAVVSRSVLRLPRRMRRWEEVGNSPDAVRIAARIAQRRLAWPRRGCPRGGHRRFGAPARYKGP